MTVESANISSRLKRVVVIAGVLLALPGVPLFFGYFCLALVLALEGDRDALTVGLVTFTLLVVTLGAGGTAAWHGLRSLAGKESKLLQLPPIWALAGGFGLLVALGLFITPSFPAVSEAWGGLGALLFPPLLAAAAALPPLMAVSWFSAQNPAGLTWRRALVALAGGATVGVLVAIVLEILFPAIILALVFNLAGVVLARVETLFEALAGADIATAVTSRSFIYVLVQVALIAPLAEELAKPLVTLPIIRHLSRRTAFLIGAMAGAGFAALENVIYAGFGFYFWAGILLVRALGGAIHPLGAGLVALGWRDVLTGEANAWRNWFMRFGMAAGMHALWNGGSLLVITLAGAQFFGELPPEIDVLGLSAAGTTLALLVVLGLAALWLGRAVGQSTPPSRPLQPDTAEAAYRLSDRAVAIWALACLVTIVPAGIAGLQLLVR
ncbi:MAG: PrsW family glutamic-type intramembrane protease [Chloroflexota bacterium]